MQRVKNSTCSAEISALLAGQHGLRFVGEAAGCFLVVQTQALLLQVSLMKSHLQGKVLQNRSWGLERLQLAAMGIFRPLSSVRVSLGTRLEKAEKS